MHEHPHRLALRRGFDLVQVARFKQRLESQSQRFIASEQHVAGPPVQQAWWDAASRTTCSAAEGLALARGGNTGVSG